MINTNSNFQKLLSYGKYAERQVYNYFSTQDNVLLVRDISNDPMGIKNDIDLELLLVDGTKVTVQVKRDSNIKRTSQGGRMFVQNVQHKYLNHVGWLYTSQADILVYVDAAQNVGYMLRMEDLRNYVESYKPILPIRTPIGNKSTGFLVDIPDLEKFCPVEHLKLEQL